MIVVVSGTFVAIKAESGSEPDTVQLPGDQVLVYQLLDSSADSR